MARIPAENDYLQHRNEGLLRLPVKIPIRRHYRRATPREHSCLPKNGGAGAVRNGHCASGQVPGKTHNSQGLDKLVIARVNSVTVSNRLQDLSKFGIKKAITAKARRLTGLLLYFRFEIRPVQGGVQGLSQFADTVPRRGECASQFCVCV